jgi:hypothetical protein
MDQLMLHLEMFIELLWTFVRDYNRTLEKRGTI